MIEPNDLVDSTTPNKTNQGKQAAIQELSASTSILRRSNRNHKLLFTNVLSFFDRMSMQMSLMKAQVISQLSVFECSVSKTREMFVEELKKLEENEDEPFCQSTNNLVSVDIQPKWCSSVDENDHLGVGNASF